MSVAGRILRVATFGESHGAAVGCVVDGMPPGFRIDREKLQQELERRRPGQSHLSTQRNEVDQILLLSGVEGDTTLGTPIAMIIQNEDTRKKDYEALTRIPRPGHADYTYAMKYGITAASGGGRSSGRETAARVAAGALASQWLCTTHGTRCVSFVSSVGQISLPDEIKQQLVSGCPTSASVDASGLVRVYDIKGEAYFKAYDGTVVDSQGRAATLHEVPEGDCQIVSTRCPHPPTAAQIAARIFQVRNAKDTIGGIATGVITNVPVGIGEPCNDKLEAELAKVMLSLPASKGFEIGEGFRAATSFLGSQHNDRFVANRGKAAARLRTETNHAGGVLGGITTGENVYFNVAFKPVASIGLPQETVDIDGHECTLEVKGRHDPCILPRLPPIIDAAIATTVMDLVLLQKTRIAVSLPTLGFD